MSCDLLTQGYSIAASTSNLANGATETVSYDFYSLISRRHDVDRWIIDWVHAVRDGSVAQAAVLLDTFKSDDYDIGLSLVLGAMPPLVSPVSLYGLLPPAWQGRFTLLVTNTSGVAMGYRVAVGIRPAPWEYRPS